MRPESHGTGLPACRRRGHLGARTTRGEPLMARREPPEIHECSVVFMDGTLGLLDQVWVAAHDLIEYWLRLEPSGRRSPNEPASLDRHVVRYQFWCSRRHRRQLHLA